LKDHANLTLGCIFDGHGGENAVQYLEKNFEDVFLRVLNKDHHPLRTIIRNTFVQIDMDMSEIEFDGFYSLCCYEIICVLLFKKIRCNCCCCCY
jgi:serine/threonine protein phosphatase PrpC